MKKILKSIGLMSIMFSLSMFGLIGNTAEATSYTAADVAAHNTAADCYMIISGNVYNLTSFVNTHSGGSAVIIGQCGKDGTAVFNSGPHNSSTINAISPLMLGPLETTPTPNPTPTPSTTPILTSVTIAPSASSVIIGGTVQLTSTPKDQNGTTISATITYTSSNTALATVNTSGLVTGVASGSVTITATSVSGSVTVIGTSSINITTQTPVLTSVIVTPATPIVKVGKTLQLVTTPKDQSGILFPGATTTYASNDHAIALIDNTTGLITGISKGAATITTTTVSGSIVITNTTIVNVSTKNPKLILTNATITPINPTLSAGGTLQLVITATDQNGATLNKAKTTFASSNHNVALVNNKSGLIKGITPGTSIITITTSNKGVILINNVVVKVTAGSTSTGVLASVVISPNTTTIDIGSSLDLSFVAKDQTGTTITDVRTKYISSNSSIVKVSSNGKATGVAAGIATITAISTNGTITVMDTATITVTGTVTPEITPTTPNTTKNHNNKNEQGEHFKKISKDKNNDINNSRNTRGNERENERNDD